MSYRIGVLGRENGVVSPAPFQEPSWVILGITACKDSIPDILAVDSGQVCAFIVVAVTATLAVGLCLASFA